MSKAFLYVRVSTEEQRKHGVSVDSQIDALKKYCSDNGIEIYDIYNDAGRSAHAKYTTRKELIRLIQDAKEHKASIILFTKLDRWFRSLGDYYKVMEQIPEDIPWKAIWEDYETETSAGRFKVNIMLSMAQAEAERTAERCKAVKDYQRSIGAFVGGRSPLGYKIQGSDVFKDQDTEEITQIIFDTFLQTKSVARVMDYLHSIGLSRSRNGLYTMLRNSCYAGDYNGYKCEPYITMEQHLDIIHTLDKNVKGRHSHTKETYLFSGIARCPECGKNMIATFTSRKVNGVEKRWAYYMCNGYPQRICTNKVNLSEKKLEKYVIEHLEEAFSLYQMSIEASAVENKTIDNKKKISALEAKLQRIGNRYEDGDISREEYREKRDAIKEEIYELQKMAYEPVQKELPENWISIYNELDKEHRKQFWSRILECIYIKGGKIDIRF